MNTITKSGLPNEFTAGEVGDIYIDSDTGYKFKLASKITITDRSSVDTKFDWIPVHENYKKIVDNAVEVLKSKTGSDVNTDNFVDELSKVGSGSNILDIIKDFGVSPSTITNTSISTSNKQYMDNIFVETLELPNATTIGTNSLQNCLALKTINAPNLQVIQASALWNCVSIKTLDFPNLTSIVNSGLYNCAALESINIPNVTGVGYYAFQNCVSLKSISLPSVTSINSNAFTNCASLESVCLGGSSVPALENTNVFGNTPISKGTGYIYVTDDLVDSYKADSKWSYYANQIKPLSEVEGE